VFLGLVSFYEVSVIVFFPQLQSSSIEVLIAGLILVMVLVIFYLLSHVLSYSGILCSTLFLLTYFMYIGLDYATPQDLHVVWNLDSRLRDVFPLFHKLNL